MKRELLAKVRRKEKKKEPAVINVKSRTNCSMSQWCAFHSSNVHGRREQQKGLRASVLTKKGKKRKNDQ